MPWTRIEPIRERRGYADALNGATGTDLLELVREVNEKYEPQTVRSR